MGLASVHGIVGALGGTITVASEPGRGTEFRIRLPVSSGEPVVEEPVWSAPSATVGVALGRRRRGDPRPDIASQRILFVEDEEPIRAAAIRFLDRCGHVVTPAVDGMEALEIFMGDPTAFDLVITDVTMPRLDGPLLVRRLRAVLPGLPVLISTGYGDADRRFGGADGVPVLTKPYSFADLEAAVARTVRPVGGDPVSRGSA